MKRSIKSTWAICIAIFILVGTTEALAAPCPPPSKSDMADMDQSAIEDLLTDYLEDMATLYKECSNPAGDLVDRLDAYAERMRKLAQTTKDYSKKTRIESSLKKGGSLAKARAGVAKFDTRLKEPCKSLKEKLDLAKKQLKQGGYPNKDAAMAAVIRSGGTVCPKGKPSREIAAEKKVFGPRLPGTDPAFDPVLDAEQSNWQDAQGIANGVLLTTF